MPRTRIDLDTSIDYLSILNEHGELDESLEPSITEKELLEMYRAVLLGRKFDERMLQLQRQGRIGTFPPIKGQEASQIGSIFHLGKEDWFVPSFRETAAEIWRGRSLESILYYYNGYNEGTIIPEGQRDLPMSVPVGSQILHATGLAYAAKYRKTGEIVISYFGDGATSEGDFHEGLNCAAVYQVPVLFVCQNNHWAISVPIKKQMHTPTVAQKAIAYGMPGIRVDGNDILAVYAATAEAAERARNGGGPTLIECVTYRVAMHTTADDPTKYRTEDEVEVWKKRDPIPRFENYLQEKGVATDEDLKNIEEQILNEIQEAVDTAEQKMKEMGDPSHMFDHLYDERPAYLERQRHEFQQFNKQQGEDANG